MQTHATASKPATRRQRPKTLTVFAAAFAAGAVLAYGVDRMVDVHVVRVMPQVESEPIFVALRSLPQGSPVTVWDVALKDWPKAMLPTTALKSDASFEGMVLRHPIREGQPLLSVQLVRDGGPLPGATVVAVPAAARRADTAIGEPFVPATPAEPPATTAAVANPKPAAREPEPVPAQAPSVEPAAEPIADTTVPSPPVAAVAPPEDPAPALPAEQPAQADAPAIVAVVPPRSTDVDETVSAPTDAATAAPSAATPATVATPAVSDVAEAEPAADQSQTRTPAPATAAPIAATAEDFVAVPLAAPVPALPSTDIERSLARFGHAHAATVQAPAAPAAQPAPPAEKTASVLDRTTQAEPPAPSQAAPKLHLVVPERIALAADASFAQPKPLPPAQPETAQPQPGTQPQPGAQPQPAARTAEAARGKAAAVAPQGRAPRKPAPANPAARKQPGPRPPSTKSQAPQNRGENAWLPTFLGGSRQR